MTHLGRFSERARYMRHTDIRCIIRGAITAFAEKNAGVSIEVIATLKVTRGPM
jgi:hypothetical protein